MNLTFVYVAEVLRQVEWGGYDRRTGLFYCPVCGQFKPSETAAMFHAPQDIGHTVDCRLGILRLTLPEEFKRAAHVVGKGSPSVREALAEDFDRAEAEARKQ